MCGDVCRSIGGESNHERMRSRPTPLSIRGTLLLSAKEVAQRSTLARDPYRRGEAGRDGVG